MTVGRTLGQRWADSVTEFSGSWGFIGWFALLCAGWLALNICASSGNAFDPYPFLFLNWLLTIVSTFQSPLILLSQNRQNDVDRVRTDEILSRLAELQLAVDALEGKS